MADLRATAGRLGRVASVDIDCPNGPDEDGTWPCNPKGYFGDAECQVCGRVGSFKPPVDHSRPIRSGE